MNRRLLAFGTVIVASIWACNFPTRGLTYEAIQLTMDAVTPLATVTSPATEQPGPGPASTPFVSEPRFPITNPPGATFEYETRSGDTLAALAGRFGVDTSQIVSGVSLPPSGYLPIGQSLRIPNVLGAISPGGDLLPDAELVYSPTAIDFDVRDFVALAGGYLSTYQETLDDGRILSGAAIVQRIAKENSVNPRLLLALLEVRNSWVYGFPADADAREYPIGFRIPGRSGLYDDLSVAASQLSRAYYGWRAGTLLETTALDRGTIRWNPTLNAGSVALLHLIVLLDGSAAWLSALVGPGGFLERYPGMFGDPWSRVGAAGPLFPADLQQPLLELPFALGENWSLTAGPHNSWSSGTPRGALDFSPITSEDPCAVSARWVTAAAPGVIVRAADNAVALDLDGDGQESTGWVLLYYHLADDGLIAAGTRVVTGDRLGHPSCEGGVTTGVHVHVVRKYNGEFLVADGPVPFVMSGWQAVAAERNYYGWLVRGGEQVTADPSGRRGSTIRR